MADIDRNDNDEENNGSSCVRSASGEVTLAERAKNGSEGELELGE